MREDKLLTIAEAIGYTDEIRSLPDLRDIKIEDLEARITKAEAALQAIIAHHEMLCDMRHRLRSNSHTIRLAEDGLRP